MGTPPNIKITAFGKTDVGLIREHNEDNLLVLDVSRGARQVETEALDMDLGPKGALFLVCDGMGGAAAGEVASQMAVEAIASTLTAADPLDRDRFARRLRRAIEDANDRIFAQSRDNQNERGMGTTCTAAALVDGTLVVGQIGDSRCYLKRDGRLAQITKDQSLAWQLMEAGAMTAEEAKGFEHANIILQALGVQERVEVVMSQVSLRKGDVVLVSSDGLHGPVTDDEILHILQEEPDLKKACDRLVARALEREGPDNVTVVLARFDGPDLPDPRPEELVEFVPYDPGYDHSDPPRVRADLAEKVTVEVTVPKEAIRLTGRREAFGGRGGGKVPEEASGVLSFLLITLIAATAAGAFVKCDRGETARKDAEAQAAIKAAEANRVAAPPVVPPAPAAPAPAAPAKPDGTGEKAEVPAKAAPATPPEKGLKTDKPTKVEAPAPKPGTGTQAPAPRLRPNRRRQGRNGDSMGSQVCSACGTATEPDARFCGVCGARLSQMSEPALDATIPDLRRMDPAVRPLPQSYQPAPHAPAAPAHHPAPAYQPPPPHQTPQRPAPSPAHGPARTNSPGAGIPAGSAKPRSMSPAQTTAAGERLGRSRLNMPRPVLPSLDRLMGRTLNGRYLVERKIGEGGFGAVFRGRQVATGREVALKILHPHNVSDATVVARFRREAEACSKLTNVHTVVIYDFDETEDGVLYLAMELLRGRPLQDIERGEGPLEPRRVLGIIAQVAEALGEAHAQGVVHRDMKPENVMIEARDGDDFVKVLDFGIAKLAEQGGKAVPALTAVGQTLGTLEFMSPEQLRGRALDGRSDLYALGIMAYEMLTGLLPWREARVPIDVIKFHLETVPPPPSALRRDLNIPREVDDLVAKMVAKDPADRHTDAAELRQHIDHVNDLLDRRGTRGRTLRVLGVAAGLVVLLAAVGIAFLR